MQQIHHSNLEEISRKNCIIKRLTKEVKSSKANKKTLQKIIISNFNTFTKELSKSRAHKDRIHKCSKKLVKSNERLNLQLIHKNHIINIKAEENKELQY